MSSADVTWREKDQEVVSWLSKQSYLKDKEWSKSQLNGLVTINNPYYDAAVEQHETLSNKPNITLMSKEALDFNFKKISYKPQNIEKPEKQIFRTDIKEDSKDLLPIENLRADAATAVTNTKEGYYEIISHDMPKIAAVPKEEYLSLEFHSCKYDFDLIEPITFSIFILEGNQIISETWNTFDTLFKMYLGNELTTKAFFNIRHASNAYLVVVCNRPFQIDNGAEVNKYYKKITQSNREKAFNVFSQNYKKLKGFWQTFAFTFIPLNEIKGGQITLPKVFLAECETKAMTPEFIAQQIERAKLQKLDQIGIEMRFYANVTEYANPNVIKNAVVCHSRKPYDLWPVLRQAHRLVINLRQAKFDFPPKFSARNIVVEVTYLCKGSFLPCIHDRWISTKLVDHAYSRGLYHVAQPQFEDEFVIELPYPVEGIVIFNFHRLSTKPTDEASIKFGNACFEVSPSHDNFVVPDSEMMLGITYSDNINLTTKPTKENYLLIETRLDSSLVTNQPTLKPVYDGELALPHVDEIPSNVLVNNLFSVLDSIFTNFDKDPEDALKCVLSLDRLIDVLPNRTILSDYLNTYLRAFAFRPSAHHCMETHKYILKEWSNYLFQTASDVNGKRRQIVMNDFLFGIIIKCIMDGGDKNIAEEIEQFSKTWATAVGIITARGSSEATHMTNNFAQFACMLADINLYSASAACIVNFVNHVGNDPTHHRLISKFLDMCLSPKLFIIESLVDDKFIGLFKSLLTQAVSKLPDGPICFIFNVLARTLSFIPDEVKPAIAKAYVSLLDCFQVKIVGSPEQLITPLSIATFIMRHITKEDFHQYFLSIPQSERLVDFVHVMLIKTKYVKDAMIFDPEAVSEAFRSIERQVETSREYGSMNKKELPGSEKGPHTLPEGGMPKKRSFAVARKAQNFPSIGSLNSMPQNNNTNYAFPQRDVALEAQLAAINVVEALLKFDTSRFDITLDLIFHLLSINIGINAVEGVSELIKDVVSKDIKALLRNRSPPFVLLIKKVLSIASLNNTFMSRTILSCLEPIFLAERKIWGTNVRSLALSKRAISLLNVSEVNSPMLLESMKLIQNPVARELAKTIEGLSRINKELLKVDAACFSAIFEEKNRVGQKATQNSVIEEFGDLLWKRAILFQFSPDACFESLRILDQYHNANGYELESINCKLSELALLAEYLTALGVMPKTHGHDHAAMAFASMTPTAAMFVMPKDIENDLPRVTGFCDSAFFNESGVMLVLSEICDMCNSHQIFETANEAIRMFVPLLESHQMYTELENIFSRSQQFYAKLDATPTQGERLMGRYYRVIFYGQCFGEDNGKIFIYREQKLTNLFNLTKRMEDTYTPLIGRGKLEIIKESRPVDVRLLDPEKGYIQITFVTPSILKGEEDFKQTTYEQNTHIKEFCFETPFMKGTNKLQGSVNNQWLRKTVLKIGTEMPSTTKRILVKPEDVENIEIEPICVSIRQLEERLKQYDAAIEANNISQLQPILNGSLCVQVNDGPLKMAEVFLSGDVRTLHTEHMRKLFKQFIDVNGKALELHRVASVGNKSFTALQEQMDKGYEDLKKKLSQYM